MSPQAEIAVRLGIAATLFAALALWEWRAPRRRLAVGRRGRWFGNLGILAVDLVAVRLLVPTAAVGVALLTAERGWGLLPALGAPYWPAAILSVIALDLTIWAQHYVFHHVPVLWRLHRVHHADILAVVLRAHHAAERQPFRLRDGQCVHVGAKRDHRPWLSTLKNSDDAIAADARPNLEAERLQVRGDECRGARLLEGQLGMLMNVATPLDELGRESARALLDVAEDGGVGSLSSKSIWSSKKQQRSSHRHE